jgi:type VI secretion system protein ImpM
MSGEAVAPGFYGKLPVRGDFLSRRLQASFIEPWDGWLQQCLAGARQILGEDWLDHYLGSPVWRYVLGQRVCGPDLVAGVLIPSVDRVGRYFPLTVATSVPALPCHPLDLLTNAGAWYESTEKVILSALDPALDLETFDARIRDLGQPLATGSDVAPLDPATGSENWRVAIADVASPEAGIEEIRESLLRNALADATLWWTRGSGRIEPCLLLCRGLPKPSEFPAMLAGGWPRFNWRVQDGPAQAGEPTQPTQSTQPTQTEEDTTL